jgi:hypothetical protein
MEEIMLTVRSDHQYVVFRGLNEYPTMYVRDMLQGSHETRGAHRSNGY